MIIVNQARVIQRGNCGIGSGIFPCAGARERNRLAEVSVTHVLVVDDDAAMREMIGSYLEGESFQVSAVADGKAMTRVLAAKSVDLIVLDLKLAGEDGLALMREQNSPDIPVIMVTGHRRDEADRIIGLE